MNEDHLASLRTEKRTARHHFWPVHLKTTRGTESTFAGERGGATRRRIQPISQMDVRASRLASFAEQSESSRIKFSTEKFYCRDLDGVIDVDLVRDDSDDASETVVVDFRTESVTAVEGRDYVAASSSVVFEPGETLKTITVQILHSAIWRPTREFAIRLPRESAACSVCILHVGAFPTTAFDALADEEDAAQEREDEAPLLAKLRLLKEFYVKLLDIEEVRTGVSYELVIFVV